jgi:hypothetical protein
MFISNIKICEASYRLTVSLFFVSTHVLISKDMLHGLKILALELIIATSGFNLETL